jgi:hypothetical protein
MSSTSHYCNALCPAHHTIAMLYVQHITLLQCFMSSASHYCNALCPAHHTIAMLYVQHITLLQCFLSSTSHYCNALCPAHHTIAMLYVQHITLFFAFNVCLHHLICLFFSRWPNITSVYVFSLCRYSSLADWGHGVISYVFSAGCFYCPICPTVFQSTTHHLSVTSTNQYIPRICSDEL